MRVLWLLIVAMGTFYSARAQNNTYPSGLYRDILQLKNKQPDSVQSLDLIRRSRDHVLAYGGNVYSLHYKDKPGTFRKLWRNCYAVSHNDTLYINCRKLGIGVGFANVLLQGRYLLFKAYIPNQSHQLSDQFAQGVISALEGTAPAPGQDHIIKQIIFHWAIDTHTGETTMLTYAGILKLLQPFESLTREFLTEEDKGTEEVIVSYLTQINARMAAH